MRIAAVIILLFNVFLHSSLANAEEAKRAVGATWLEAIDGNKQALHQYLRANWLAMDQKAVEQGVFVSYQLLENPTVEDDWDFLMLVTYKDDKGYEGVKTKFDAIRAAHQEVLVDEKSLRQLGRVLRSTYYYETIHR